MEAHLVVVDSLIYPVLDQDGRVAWELLHWQYFAPENHSITLYVTRGAAAQAHFADAGESFAYRSDVFAPAIRRAFQQVAA